MIKKMMMCCVLCASIMLVGCGTTGTNVSPTDASASTGSKVQDVVAQYLPYIRPATALVCNVVLQLFNQSKMSGTKAPRALVPIIAA